MKKFSLLILSVLLLSCSSDDEDAKEGNFLEVYNGVVWKEPLSKDIPEYGFWNVFTTESFLTAEYMPSFGCYSDTYKWGVADSDGASVTVQENSKNKLILKWKESGEFTYVVTYTASNDGKVLYSTYIDRETKVETTDKYDRVTLSATDPC